MSGCVVCASEERAANSGSNKVECTAYTTMIILAMAMTLDIEDIMMALCVKHHDNVKTLILYQQGEIERMRSGASSS